MGSVYPADYSGLKKLGHLTAEIGRGAKRLMRAPEELFMAFSAESAATTRERDRLAGDLDALESSGGADAEKEADAAVDRLWTLGAASRIEPPAAST